MTRTRLIISVTAGAILLATAGLSLKTKSVPNLTAQTAVPGAQLREPAQSQPLYASAEETSAPFVPRDLFNSSTFGRVTPSQIASHLDVKLGFPVTANGGTLQGIYVPAGDYSPMEFYDAIYSNDIVVAVTVLPTTADAEQWVEDYTHGGAEYYVANVDVGGVEALAIPRLDVEPVFDPKTNAVKPGTGISTGTARVIWRRGRFVIAVMNPDETTQTLAVVARSVTFVPNSTSDLPALPE